MNNVQGAGFFAEKKTPCTARTVVSTITILIETKPTNALLRFEGCDYVGDPSLYYVSKMTGWVGSENGNFC